MMNPLEQLMSLPDVPVEDRIAQFDSRPTDTELGACLGLGLMSSSGIYIQEDVEHFKVMPKQIPVRAVGNWMYCVVALLVALPLFLQPIPNLPLAVRIVPWVILIVAAILIIPTMKKMFSWINERTGTEPYLVFNKVSEEVQLPRLNTLVPKAEIREIVFLKRFVNGNPFQQTALLAREGSKWNYFHLFNEAGTTTDKGLWGNKRLYQQVADNLEIESRKVEFSKRESKYLG